MCILLISSTTYLIIWLMSPHSLSSLLFILLSYNSFYFYHLVFKFILEIRYVMKSSYYIQYGLVVIISSRRDSSIVFAL